MYRALLLGREPLRGDYVLLLLTKELRRLPETEPVEAEPEGWYFFSV